MKNKLTADNRNMSDMEELYVARIEAYQRRVEELEEQVDILGGALAFVEEQTGFTHIGQTLDAGGTSD